MIDIQLNLWLMYITFDFLLYDILIGIIIILKIKKNI